MIKYKIIFLLAFVLVVCGNAFSQTKKELFYFPTEKADTFYIHETLFKIYAVDDNALIEKFENKKWNVIDTIEIQKYIRSIDVHKNGFPDIAIWEKFSYDVYLFNPEKNTFIHSDDFSTIDLNDTTYYSSFYTGKSFGELKMQLVNKELNIYYDFAPGKRREISSDLFQLKDYKKIVLGNIFQYTHLNTTQNRFLFDKVDIIRNLKNPIIHPIIKGKNGISYQQVPTTDTTIETINDTGVHEFDYEKYWKNNWQKFLPNKD